MHVSVPTTFASSTSKDVQLRLGYLWGIAFIAALGGLLFGYDWVVIGGAKPFYEAHFHLTSDALIGWANSCALVGCFVGSLIAGPGSDRFGRKKTLLASAILFTASSILTGWSPTFDSFVTWRIIGGVAIGLSSNVSPMYIAEISPAQWRGRLVSLNQFAIVIGILLSQIVNLQIADKSSADLHGAALALSWNARLGWRWMFTAVAVPSAIFVVAVPFLPESPRWLALRERKQQALQILSRIGGPAYGDTELATIERGLQSEADTKIDWRQMFRPTTRRLVVIGMALAVLQQGSGINILFNYAQEVYQSAGYGLNAILVNIVITGVINLVFTIIAMFLVDRFGRRRLMIAGCILIGIAHIAASLAYSAHRSGPWVLALTLCAIACYAMTLAPVTWVLITEIFPNQIRASAVSVSVATLWVASFLLTYTFPTLNRVLHTSGTFLVYAGICLCGALFVYRFVPETRGRSLESIGEFVELSAHEPIGPR